MKAGDMFFKDGTPYEPPENPLLHDDKYKKQERWGFNCPVWGYQCMFCSNCPMGDYYKYSEEELKVEEEYKKLLKNYQEDNEKLHGELMIYLPD